LPEFSPNRDLRLDFFRGLALFLIFIDHIPENILSYFTLQGVTFFDAAEVFIFISGFTAALVYGRRLAVKGAVYMAAQVWHRAWQLYVAHIFLFVLFIAEVSYTVLTFNNPMYNEEMRVGEFLDEPHVAIVKALLLEFQPTFLDILPLYIVMLLIFPAVLYGLARRPLWVLVPSALVYGLVQLSGISVPAYPEGHVWFFNPLAWQLLFVLGAALGLYYAQGGRFSARLLRVAYPLAALIFAVTVVIKITWTIHGVWDSFPGLLLRQLWPVNKNNLALLRLIPFLALVVLVAEWVPVDARFLSHPAARPVLSCGRQSLEIFCLSILLSALGHFVLSEYNSGIPMQFAVNAAGIVLMCLTAKLIDWYKTMDRIPMLQPALAVPRRDNSAAE
jgi:hypothetical protein